MLLRLPLAQHDLLVTSIDWCPVTGRIVTCSQDRNAFVWTLNASTGEWAKQMVLLRINRAATSCRWSPNGKKFAVSSGSNTVCICSFDEVSDWWVSQAITRFKSTVNSVEWHPNSMLVAAVGCDYHCRIAAVSLVYRCCAWARAISARQALGGLLPRAFTCPALAASATAPPCIPAQRTLTTRIRRRG